MAHKITELLACGLLLLTAANIVAGESDLAPNQPRDPAAFADLFAKSPFAMASVSTQSPLSQRFTITGTMTVDDKPQLFLLDKTTQERLMISIEHPDGGVTLVSLQGDGDPAKVQAMIRVGSDTGVVTFEKTPAAPDAGTPPSNPDAGRPTITGTGATVISTTPPAAAAAAEAPSGSLPAPPVRHPIRRSQAPMVPPPGAPADSAPPTSP